MEKKAEEILRKIQATTKQVTDNTDASNAGFKIIGVYLGRWTGSIYRLIWLDMLLWCVAYTTVSLVYRLALNDAQKTYFENVVIQVGYWSAKIPVTFLLGFFVSNVVSRWWNIYMNIPKMSGGAAIITGCVRSKTNPEEAARIRTTITRYLNLAWVLALWEFCGPLKKRFEMVHKLQHQYKPVLKKDENGKLTTVTTAGVKQESQCNSRVYDNRGYDITEQMQGSKTKDLFPTLLSSREKVHQKLSILNQDPVIQQYYGYLVSKSEIRVFLRRAKKAPPKGYKIEWWLPIFWALALADEALSAGYVRDTNTLVQVQSVIYSWYSKIRLLINYAKRQLPLVYIQVVIIAVYTVYFTEIIMTQFIDTDRAATRKLKEGYVIDYFFPILAIIHIVFIIGWFKVAMVLLDPFGNDIEDFQFSAFLTGNIKTGAAQASNDPLLYPRTMRHAVTTTFKKTGGGCVIEEDVGDESSSEEEIDLDVVDEGSVVVKL